MKKKSFNVFTFWAHIARPTFLQTIQKEKPTKTLWGAWFLWNTLLAVLITGLGFWGLNALSSDLENELWPQVAEFEFVFEDQKLISTGLEEPFRYEFNDPEADADGVFIIDLAGEQYDESSLKVFDVAALVNQDGIIVYEADKRKVQTIPFSEFPELKNKTINKQDAYTFLQTIKPSILGVVSLFIFAFSWFFYCALRLIWISVMAFLFWILGLIARTKELTYGDCFIATLGLSFLPTLVGIGLIATGNFHLGLVTLLYLILFGLNIYDAPKSPKKKS